MTVIKILPPPPIKYLNFAITQSVVNIYTELLRADRCTTGMRHIKWELSSNGSAPPSGMWQWPFFSKFARVAYQIKWNDACSILVSNI